MLMSAPSWRGPYINITHGFNDSIDTGEDPEMFRTRRGWHMLNHNAGPSSTMLEFSPDGLTWQRAQGLTAFNGTVRWTNGSVTELCRRQRPKVVMSASDGMPAFLWTGVMDGGGDCELNPTWTLAQSTVNHPRLHQTGVETRWPTVRPASPALPPLRRQGAPWSGG